MKYFFRRDTVLLTIAVFIIIGCVGVLPLNLHVFSPIKVVLSDISFNDLAFSSKSAQTSEMDDRLVIVSTGDYQREDIAKLLTKLETYSPKVVGLDVLFSENKDSLVDNFLRNTLKAYNNIVVSEKIDWPSDDDNLPSIENIFHDKELATGYVNFVGLDSGVIRYYSPFEKGKGYNYSSFSTATVEIADPAAYKNLIARNNETEWINFTRTAEKYYIIEGKDIMNDIVESSFINNKIVLVGFVSPDENNIEDKYFTPLNSKFIGKSVPDMNGIIINANIISMILDGDYVHKSPLWLNIFIAFLLTWIIVSISIQFYLHRHLTFYLLVPVIHLITAILSIYIGILLLKLFNVNIDFTLSVLAVVLSVEVLYFYKAFVLWLHKKYAFKTLFSKTHRK